MKVIGRTAASNGVSSEVAILDEDNMASDSAVSLATQQSIKAYVDAQSHSTVTASSTTTFTNKTIDQDATGNSITNIADASIKASAAIAQSKILNLTTDLSGKSPTAGNGSLVTVGALNSGSITSGFGNINIGSSTITTTGAVATGAITAGGTISGNLTGNVTGNASGSSGSTTGNAATATALATARTIGGVSFDGTANINLPGVNSAGNQNTSGTAATVTGAAQSAITSVGTLTTLTVDNLTINANKIESINAGGAIELAPKTTGVVTVIGNTNDGAITLNCTSNTHGQTIKSQPHSASATNTMLLPLGANSTLVSLVSADTLTNKTLTSPVVNVTSDATGDVYYRNASGLFTRLAAGGTGTVLTIASGIPSWASPAGGGATILHDYTIQASTYTGGAPSGTTRSVFIRTIDANNEGIFVKIKKNGTAGVEVQIA
jgi:hypothetical protein